MQMSLASHSEQEQNAYLCVCMCVCARVLACVSARNQQKTTVKDRNPVVWQIISQISHYNSLSQQQIHVTDKLSLAKQIR